MAGVAYLQQQPNLYSQPERYEYLSVPRLPPFFCQARFDYQSQDPSALSFIRGDVIEVFTQLETGWWDGVLNNERGWFPSNYVVQLSDEDVRRIMNSQFENGRQMARDNEWDRTAEYSDSAAESTLNATSSQEFWAPEVTDNGQIFYVNTVTGEIVRDLPVELDPEAQPVPYSLNHSNTQTSRSRSNSRATDTTAGEPREVAGYGVRRQSPTPDPWVKQLADDGMTYYYINPTTGQTSWTLPSPDILEKTRMRSQSNATYDSNRESIISDSSDVHPFVTHASSRPDSPDRKASIDVERTPAEAAALRLQEALFPVSTLTFNALVSDTRTAIANIWEPGLHGELLKQRVDDAVTAIRKLLCKAGTLPSNGKMQEILAEKDEFAQTRVKTTQRKLVATLSKVVLSARAVVLNPASELNRVRQDAADLDECVVNFAQEIERQELADIANQRLAGLLVSAEGSAGIGTGLVGAGIGGGWKGFGFVPTTENAPQRILSSTLITDFQDQESILREKADALSNAYSASEPSEVRNASRDFLSRLFIFVNALADTNVAQRVDVDSMPSHSGIAKENAYVKSVHRARILVRRLEALTQSIYDHGGTFVLSAQELSDSASNRVIPFMEQVGDAVAALEQLSELGEEQSGMVNTKEQSYDYKGSIIRRMSRVNPGVAMDMLGRSLEQEATIDDSILDDEGSDVVGMAEALYAGARAPNSAASHVAVRQLDLSPSEEYGHNDRVGSRPPQPPPDGDIDSVLEEDEDEEQGLNIHSKAKPNTSKLQKIFGPDRELPSQVANAHETERPWYLKPDSPPQDLMFTNNHDDTIRAGTLPALIEHLTDHYRRDQNFIRTFLTTFKSFSTVGEVFTLLVARFKTPLPDGLTAEQIEEWKKSKQTPLQVRVINIMKQLILDDELLDPDEKGTVVQQIKDFAVSSQEEASAAKLLVQLANRSLAGGDVVVVKPTISPSNPPPPPLLPRTKPKLKLMDIDPTEMARQLTIMESDLYKKIRAIDCLNRAKEQKGKNAASDHISAIIDHTNKVTMWINQQILERDDTRKRAAVIKYFISVAERCHVLQNYSTMAAMVSGLNTPPIRRLKRTWSQVGGRGMTSLESSEKLFDSNKNFNNYRQELTRIEAPCVPFLGVYLTTLIYIHEGSKDILPPPDPPKIVNDQPLPPPTGPLINFAKRQKAAETIREIKSWQSKPYNLVRVNVLQAFIEESLAQCNKVDEMSEQFWARSLELEPRERDDEKMARLLQESGFL